MPRFFPFVVHPSTYWRNVHGELRVSWTTEISSPGLNRRYSRLASGLGTLSGINGWQRWMPLTLFSSLESQTIGKSFRQHHFKVKLPLFNHRDWWYVIIVIFRLNCNSSLCQLVIHQKHSCSCPLWVWQRIACSDCSRIYISDQNVTLCMLGIFARPHVDLHHPPAQNTCLASLANSFQENATRFTTRRFWRL